MSYDRRIGRIFPALVTLMAARPRAINAKRKVAAVPITITLAWLMFSFVEKPLRTLGGEGFAICVSITLSELARLISSEDWHGC